MRDWNDTQAALFVVAGAAAHVPRRRAPASALIPMNPTLTWKHIPPSVAFKGDYDTERATNQQFYLKCKQLA